MLAVFELLQLVESETNHNAIAKELANARRKMAELDDESRLKDREYTRALDESRRNEKSLDDERQRLAAELEAARSDITEMELKLTASNGRVGALEEELENCEAARRQIEIKLTTVVSTLRRSVGLARSIPTASSAERGGSISPLFRARSRSPSPRRRRFGVDDRSSSPERVVASFRTRSVSPAARGGIAAGDIDVDGIRDTLRNLVQQMVSAERDRVSGFCYMSSIASQLRPCIGNMSDTADLDVGGGTANQVGGVNVETLGRSSLIQFSVSPEYFLS